MSLAALQAALLELAAGALDDADRTVPDECDRIRYNGEPPVTKCCENGLLTIHWRNPQVDREGFITRGGGRPSVDLDLRLYRCWPTIDETGHFPGADAAADELAGDFDAIWQALTVAICEGSLNEHLSGCDQLALTGGGPRSPSGGCAGVQFLLRAGWKPWD